MARFSAKDAKLLAGGQLPPLTKDQINKSAVEQLKAMGCRVRKVHNVPVNKNRRHHIEKGWPDIQGYSDSGESVMCEVKTRNDKLSPEQIERLEDLNKCGGIAFVAFDNNGHVELRRWHYYKEDFKVRV